MSPHLPVKLENYSYLYFIKELIKQAHIHRFEVKLIGHERYEEIGMTYPLYRFTINPLQAEGTFCIAAGVQAYEIAGPLCMVELFINYKQHLNPKIRYFIYPMVNPTSFDLRSRTDDDNVDLNTVDKRSLISPKYVEVQRVIKDIGEKDFDIFMSLHEDVGEKRFYAYVFQDHKNNPAYKYLIQNMSEYAEIVKGQIYKDRTNGNGLIINHHDHSFEDYLWTHKKAKLSLCTETPGLLNLNKRIEMNLANIAVLSEWLVMNKTTQE